MRKLLPTSSCAWNVNYLRKVARVDGRANSRILDQLESAVQELQIAAIAFEVQDGIMITDASNTIIRVNQSFTRITGYTAEEAVGRAPAMLKSDRQRSEFYVEMWRNLNETLHWQGEIWNKRKNGDIYPERLNITAITNDTNEIINYVASFSDISQYKQAQAEIYNLEFYDTLTHLPNRRMLLEHLEESLGLSVKNNDYVAVMFIDLDHFKNINDSSGYSAGDSMLIEVGQRLQRCVRSADMVAKMGGDEYVVVLESLGGSIKSAIAQADIVAKKMHDAFIEPFIIQNHKFHISASIGIGLANGQAYSIDEIFRHADAAMHQAKRAGRNTWRFFDPLMHKSLEARMALEFDLHHAITDNQLELYYQVQAHKTDGIVGAEALIRWNHPIRGVIPPNDFIPLAEETGLILQIGKWVLEEACKQIKRWEGSIYASNLSIAVNVSAQQFSQSDFVEVVFQTLTKTLANPKRLKLEITESLALNDIDQTRAKMMSLRKIGVRFSLDDFGTGYSSLSYLTRLPLDQLKIDRSFVSNVTHQASDASIVQTIIGMAKNLNMEVIAEGVEVEEQMEFLESHGCLVYQGYLFSRPLPLGEFEQVLERNAS